MRPTNAWDSLITNELIDATEKNKCARKLWTWLLVTEIQFVLSPVLYDVDAADAVSARNLVQVQEQLQRLVLHGAVGLVRHLYSIYIYIQTEAASFKYLPRECTSTFPTPRRKTRITADVKAPSAHVTHETNRK